MEVHGSDGHNSDSLDFGRLDQSFFGANPNWLEYIVFTKVQMLETGTGGGHPRFGVYAAYVDHRNWFAAMLDVTSCGGPGCLTTGGQAAGLQQPWLNCPLPAGFQARAVNMLVVEAVQGRFNISVNGEKLAGTCQDRKFDLSAGQRHASNGQAGVLVENTRAAYTGFDVSPGVPLDFQESGQTYTFRNRASRLNLDSGCDEGCEATSSKGSSLIVRAPFSPPIR